MSLPSVFSPLSPPPPFQAPPVIESELPSIGQVRCVERVDVGVDAGGAPVKIGVLQRLTISKLGDYTFSIPGPFTSARAAPGSQSRPGLRRGAILWAGFSPGHRVLAAEATLDVSRAAQTLPLRLTLARGGGRVSVHLANVTATPATVPTAAASPADAAAVLDAIRDAASRPALAQESIVLRLRGFLRTKRVDAVAPLRVSGSLTFAHRTVRFRTTLGDGSPLEHVVTVTGVDELPRLRVVVSPSAPTHLLQPPAGGSWRAYVRGRTVNGTRLASRAFTAQLARVRMRQFQTFLANPDQFGPTSTTYVFATTSVPAKPSAAPAQPDEGNGAAKIVVALVLGIAAAAGLVVLWANN